MWRRRLVLLPFLAGGCGAHAPTPTAPQPTHPAPLTVSTAPVAPETLPPAPPEIRLRYRGVNLSGGEFGAALPGRAGTDYRYPGAAEVDFFRAQGMNFVRLPFREERLQPKPKGELLDEEWVRLLDAVIAATSRGMTVAIEAHSSARITVNGATRHPTETELGDFWGRVATRVHARGLDEKVWLDLANEPHDMPTEAWVALANAGLREIRRVGYTGTALIEGNGWSGGGHWTSSWYGESNSIAMLRIVDPGSRIAFEVHQYLDAEADGTGDCVSPTIGVERLTGFTRWLRANGKVGLLGELGAINTPTCAAAVKAMLAHVERYYDVWLGWAWWNGGVWSSGPKGTYPLTIGPTDPGQAERPQLAWITPFVPIGRPPR